MPALTFLKPLRSWHSEHTPRNKEEVRECTLYPSGERGSVLLSVQVFLCEWLPPQHSQQLPTAQSPCSLQHYSTLTAWERQTLRKEGGGEQKRGRRVLLCCSLTVLFVQPFRCPPQREQLSISTHPRGAATTQAHGANFLIPHTQKRQQCRGGIRGWTGAMDASMRLREVWKVAVKPLWTGANTQHAKRDTEATEWTQDYKLTEDMCIYTMVKQTDIKSCKAERVWTTKARI